jgi:hypothetical protein
MTRHSRGEDPTRLPPNHPHRQINPPRSHCPAEGRRAGRSSAVAPRRCPGCAHQAGSAAEAWVLHSELSTTWLVLDAHGTVQPRRFCHACMPDGPVGDLSCTQCGDGPLLAGDLARPTAAALVERWLHTQGWRTGPAPTCPTCSAARARVGM